MEDNRQEQKEALEVLSEFNDRLLKNMNIIEKELNGARLDDTDQFLKGIVDAINWEIQVVNGTLPLLNEGEERLNKEEFNTRILMLSNAIAENRDERMAEAFRQVIPVFEQLGAAARAVTA